MTDAPMTDAPMTDDLEQHFTLLDELDARQDDVLQQLDELNCRIELLLGEFTKPLEREPFSPTEKAA